MAKYWVVEVSIPFSRGSNLDEIFALCRELEEEVGSCGGSGAGMGNRDMDWSFTTEAEADTHHNRILQFFSERIIPTGDDFSDGDPVQLDVSEYDDED